ncbi:MAG: hypothetical protein OIF50_07950 [Flavobacteriaceae bacterium]|nr:hypothetical protein [Flavobacteriaceae bacterium]
MGEDMQANIGMNHNTVVGINKSEQVGGLSTESVAGNKMLLVNGDFTEVFEQNVHSESKEDRKEVTNGEHHEQAHGEMRKKSQKRFNGNGGEGTALH